MHANSCKGFTLIEMIFGIVLMAIVLTIITGLIVPQAKQSADPVIQVKANELGQAMMNEVLSRSFDENSDRSPPFRRCSENGNPKLCTDVSSLGADSDETRATFDDVDDYIGTYSGDTLENSLGEEIDENYPDFLVTIEVGYDSDLNGIFDSNEGVNPSFKLIVIEVTAPNNEKYGFSAYRGNY